VVCPLVQPTASRLEPADRTLRHMARFAELEAVYEGLDSAEAACRRGWSGLRDAIVKARAVADAFRDDRIRAQAKKPKPPRDGRRTSASLIEAAPLMSLDGDHAQPIHH